MLQQKQGELSFVKFVLLAKQVGKHLWLFKSGNFLFSVKRSGCLQVGLGQGWANYGPPEHFVRSANTC